MSYWNDKNLSSLNSIIIFAQAKQQNSQPNSCVHKLNDCGKKIIWKKNAPSSNNQREITLGRKQTKNFYKTIWHDEKKSEITHKHEKIQIDTCLPQIFGF